MQPNTTEIIRITADLQQHIRAAIVELIQSGAKLGSMHSLIEVFDSLDRQVREMSTPANREIMPDDREMQQCRPNPDTLRAVEYWHERAVKAEAELHERRMLAQMGQTPESLAIAEEMGH